MMYDFSHKLLLLCIRKSDIQKASSLVFSVEAADE